MHVFARRPDGGGVAHGYCGEVLEVDDAQSIEDCLLLHLGVNALGAHVQQLEDLGPRRRDAAVFVGPCVNRVFLGVRGTEQEDGVWDKDSGLAHGHHEIALLAARLLGCCHRDHVGIDAHPLQLVGDNLSNWAREAVSRGISDQARVIRLPVHVAERVRQLNAAERKLAESLGRDPNAEELGWTAKQVDALRTKRQ